MPGGRSGPISPASGGLQGQTGTKDPFEPIARRYQRQPPWPSTIDRQISELIHRAEDLAAALDRLGGDQHEGDDARLGAAVDPIVDGAALDQHVAGRKVYGRSVHL